MPAFTILVIEDEDAIRLSMRDYLDRSGHTVLLASDGVGGLKMLLDHPEIQCIVTDYRIGVLGGDYWIRFLQRFCSDIPVIVTSGFLRPGSEIPFDVVYKPFDYGELEDLIVEKIRGR